MNLSEYTIALLGDENTVEGDSRDLRRASTVGDAVGVCGPSACASIGASLSRVDSMLHNTPVLEHFWLAVYTERGQPLVHQVRKAITCARKLSVQQHTERTAWSNCT